jgi:hypothetical protein
MDPGFLTSTSDYSNTIDSLPLRNANLDSFKIRELNWFTMIYMNTNYDLLGLIEPIFF